MNSWRAFQWVWKKKILLVKLNTYRHVLFEKKIFVLVAELEEQNRTTALDNIKHKVENKATAEFWEGRLPVLLCHRYAKEARPAVWSKSMD